jgi:putative oxidoreductase
MRGAAHAILRIGAGLLFVEHGLQKIIGIMGGFGAPGATAPLMSRFGVAGWLELAGGALIILGAFTQPVAAVLAVEMIIAFFIAHLPRGGWPVQNAGELALLYCVIFVFLAANGAGPYSVDRRTGIRLR